MHQDAHRDQGISIRIGIITGSAGPDSGIRNTTISLGVDNITEEWPPLTANTIYSGGYLTSLADMMGRVYRASVEYKF